MTPIGTLPLPRVTRLANLSDNSRARFQVSRREIIRGRIGPAGEGIEACLREANEARTAAGQCYTSTVPIIRAKRTRNFGARDTIRNCGGAGRNAAAHESPG